MTVEIGRPAPEFALRDQHGATVSLSSFRGSRAVVLMFYPFAFSSVCSGELSEIRENLPRFESDDAQLLAVSCDPMFSLRAFAEADRLPFPLLSDFWPHGAVAQQYGVFNDKAGMATRGTFLIDTEGVLRWSVVNGPGDARPLAAYQEAVAAL